MSESTRELLDTLAKVLSRCCVFGFGLLAITFVMFLTMREPIHHLHGHMFGLSTHEIDVMFYGVMGLVKLWVGVFFLIPWLAIKLVTAKA